MQRKLEIIRSLMHMPQVLFLDEPTQGLDALSRRNLWEYINHVRREHGTTVFLTTHYIDEAEHVDKVCIINQGKIATCCPPEEMKKSLLRRELILDANNRSHLVDELTALNLPHHIEEHVTVTYHGRSVQEIIASLHTPLTVLNIHEPSLEDAYIEFLNRTKGETA
jgi:ABC-2 type transport system ATP-binding protein